MNCPYCKDKDIEMEEEAEYSDIDDCIYAGYFCEKCEAAFSGMLFLQTRKKSERLEV